LQNIRELVSFKPPFNIIMFKNTLKFYMVYFHINDFNLINFREEIISIYKNNDPIYDYDFQVNSLYYLHLFQPNGLIIGRLPIKLLSVKDYEDVIEDLFLDLLPYIDKYLKRLETQEFPEFPSYIGMYVSALPEDTINPKELVLIKDKQLNGNLRAYKNFYINNVLNKKISYTT
jgi:hypothetical protein